ncbi:MAG: site-specific DNA-methyltransferase, partial [Opitutaceae bacterium]|nr:site-specific DNA-methyltransferase [Opitutaceae bacterium]
MSKYAHLSHDELVRLLEARDRRDATRFGLVWEASEIERDKALNSDFVALDLDPAQSVGAGPWENLVIEGDNFDALRHLRMTFAGRVKCIYIDPPYNTGNRDFVYNDRFVDANDAWRHSTWCEFMWQRLSLAKDLLRQDGVIFVSIDDNEIYALGLLMNKIFGEGNFVANVIWQKNYAPKNSAKHFSSDHDFIVVYALNGETWKPNLLARTAAQNEIYKNPDNDPRGPWRPDNLSARNPYSLGKYAITTPGGRVISGPPPGRYWVVSEEKFKALVADNRIWFGKDGNNIPAPKRFLSEVMDGRVPQTLWSYSEVGHTQDAKKELLKLLPDADVVFSTPKPVTLMEKILRIATNPGDLVLDFFAGSGTTAHAVLKLNAEGRARPPGAPLADADTAVSAKPPYLPRRFILVS